MEFEEFAEKYSQAFHNAMKYTPNEVGSQIFAEKMACMSDEHPDWVELIEANEELR